MQEWETEFNERLMKISIKALTDLDDLLVQFYNECSNQDLGSMNDVRSLILTKHIIGSLIIVTKGNRKMIIDFLHGLVNIYELASIEND